MYSKVDTEIILFFENKINMIILDYYVDKCQIANIIFKKCLNYNRRHSFY